MEKGNLPTQQYDNKTPAQLDDEIDLLEFWRALKRGKWIIFSFIVVSSIVSVLLALSLPDMYKSTAVLAPAESAGSGSLDKLAGQFGGIASLAGISLGDASSSKTAEALEILQSWGFIEEFIQEQNIASQVFAVKGWNSETNELVYDTDIYDLKTETWTREPPKGKKPKPSSWELYDLFINQYVSISQDSVSGFTQASIEYYSPEVARRWVDELIKKINLKLQMRDSADAEKNVAFLKAQIEETSLASMQSVFYELIEEQTKTLMLAKGSTEYVFKTVSEARVAEEKSKPQRALICLFGVILGGLLGSVVALGRGLKL